MSLSTTISIDGNLEECHRRAIKSASDTILPQTRSVSPDHDVMFLSVVLSSACVFGMPRDVYCQYRCCLRKSAIKLAYALYARCSRISVWYFLDVVDILPAVEELVVVFLAVAALAVVLGGVVFAAVVFFSVEDFVVFVVEALGWDASLGLGVEDLAVALVVLVAGAFFVVEVVFGAATVVVLLVVEVGVVDTGAAVVTMVTLEDWTGGV